MRKELPHIPFVLDFAHFSNIGKKLRNLHLNYERQPPIKGVKILKNGNVTKLEHLTKDDLKVKKIKINKNDLSKIEFNSSITIEGIPKKLWNIKSIIGLSSNRLSKDIKSKQIQL